MRPTGRKLLRLVRLVIATLVLAFVATPAPPPERTADAHALIAFAPVSTTRVAPAVQRSVARHEVPEAEQLGGFDVTPAEVEHRPACRQHLYHCVLLC
jgi:hypothetical protein